MKLTLTPAQHRLLWGLAVLAIGVRLVTLGAYPLLDPSESRYAEIARKMLETGQWLVPQYQYGVPFWGKPPLAFWLSAASMWLFGVNEFGARLPSLLLTGGCGAIVWRLASLHAGRAAALLAVVVFATTGLVFIAAGAVLTDAALALGTTLAMAGFWSAVHGSEAQRRTGGLAFFLGLAVGLLAKGPVAVVLTMFPIGLWTLWKVQWRAAWTRLSWVAGTLLVIALVVPWYWAVERATPGFLDYFLVGEHWKRFTVPGWTGDRYGVGHAWKRGWIWLFWIAAAVPWSFVLLDWLVRAAVGPRALLRERLADPFWSYLVVWALAPMVFFTAAGNVLITYVLPGLPALALLVVFGPTGAARTQPRSLDRAEKTALAASFVIGSVFVGLLATQHVRIDRELTQRALVRAFEAARTDPRQRLVYQGDEPVSAEFYSNGRARRVTDESPLARYLADDTSDFFAMRQSDVDRLTGADLARLVMIGEFGKFRLFREVPRDDPVDKATHGENPRR